MAIQRALKYGLCAILILAPLPFGSVQPWATAILIAACCALAVVWIVWRSRRGLAPLPWRDPVLAAGGLIVLLGVLQTVPLPRPILKTISPKAVEFRDRYEPPPTAAIQDSGLRPISMYSWATREATLKFVAFWLMLLVTIDLAAVGSTHRTIATALVASGGFQAIYGLAEYFSGHQQIFGYSKKYYADVATGTFINRNHFAGYLEMTIPLAIALTATSFSRLTAGSRSLGQRLAAAPGQEIFRTGALMVLSLTMATALVCSRSRMGIASTLMALLAVGVFLAWRGRGKGFMVAAVVVVAATLLLFSQGGAGYSVVGRFLGTPADLTAGVGRWGIWTQASAMVKAFPLVGVGLGVFPAAFPLFRSMGEGVYLDHAHNDYIEFAAEAGVAGCVVFVIAGALVIRSMLRRPVGVRNFGMFGSAAIGSVLAIGLHSITDFNLAIPNNALTALVLLGIVICWTRSPSPILAVDREPQRLWVARSLLPATALIGIALVGLSPLGPGFPSQSKNRANESRLSLAMVGERVPDAPKLKPGTMALWGNAERLFQAASNLGTDAIRDMQVLVNAKAEGQETSKTSAEYIQSRLREAIALQTLALRQFPLYSGGHLAFGHMIVSRCAAEALTSEGDVDCIAEGMPEFRLALELNSTSVSAHTRVATFLLAAWAVMTDAQRVEARMIIAKAVRLDRTNKSLNQQWQDISGQP